MKELTLYAHLAYAYDLNGQTTLAYNLAKDFALLNNYRIQTSENFIDLSMVASILRKNDDVDFAYDLLLSAYQIEKTRIIQYSYYLIYNHQILLSDISPWLIRNQFILVDTQDDWQWLVEEMIRRGDEELGEEISIWLAQLSGITSLNNKQGEYLGSPK
jgi:hypothetical protein